MENKIQQLQEIFDASKHIVFFTGAGVSTDSGIPDFRSQDGLYNLSYQYPPEQIISHSFFMQNPEEFYRFYREKMIYLDAKPNSVHQVIADYETIGKSLGVVTQNIDGLHQMAGSKRVYELHGSILRNYCQSCYTFYDVHFIKDTTPLPICTKCGSLVKPDVVLYQEGLNQSVLEGAIAAIQSADTLVVLGTSLVVYPAAGLIQYFYGKNLILINKDATPYDNQASLCIHATFDQIFPHIKVK